jgi:hypothetical protein
MTQYMLAVHGSEGSSYVSDEEMQRAFRQVDALNTELRAAGAWVFGGGLHAASTATVVRNTDGKVVTTDGPYLETKEHIGGFWIIEVENLDQALNWAERASEACMGPVEVRPFQDN